MQKVTKVNVVNIQVIVVDQTLKHSELLCENISLCCLVLFTSVRTPAAIIVKTRPARA